MAPPRLAWLGLGNMGRGMVKNIVEKSDYSGPLLIYNRTYSRAEKLASDLSSPGKTKPVESIAEAVQQSDIIFTCVGDDDAILSTIGTALEALDSDSNSKLFVDCSTVHPDTTAKLQERIEAAGSAFVACPVFGAPAMADAGQLICVLAGRRSAVEKVKPFCKGVMGRAEVDFADQPCGNASRLKIVGNTMILQMVESLSECHVLAEKCGLGTEDLHAFIEVMFPGPYTAYSKRMTSGDYYLRDEPAFQAKLARKDFRHAKSLADACGASMKGLDAAGAHLDQVIEHAGDQGDMAGLYGAVRKESGLKFENSP